MGDEAVDDFLTALKVVPHWFIINKMIRMLFTALYADENILYFDEDSVMSYLFVMKLVFLI